MDSRYEELIKYKKGVEKNLKNLVSTKDFKIDDSRFGTRAQIVFAIKALNDSLESNNDYHVVYLFKPNGEGVFLNLMFVVTNFRKGRTFTAEEYDKISLVRDNFRDYIKKILVDKEINFNKFSENLDLEENSDLAIAYGKGSLFSIYYDFKDENFNIDENQFINDLNEFLDLNIEVSKFHEKFLEIKDSITPNELKLALRNNDVHIIDQIDEEESNDSNNSNFENYNKIILYDNSDRKKNGRNILLYGVPGSGKSHKIKKYFEKHKINESQFERVIFHPDYTYSDFVGQILPKVENNNPIYKFSPGPFTLILDKAFHNPEYEYYLVIEEINRGNAPAIFGDIFQLLDRIDDDENEYPLCTSEYSITNADLSTIYTESEREVYGNKVRIPSNLSIIATMNTSDQNVFTLDTAFQRRWNMEMIKNNWDDTKLNFEIIEGTDMTWSKFGQGMNKLIVNKNKHGLSSEDKRLGAYFIKKEDFEEFETDEEIRKLFAEKVLKYLWDDAFKFDRGDVFDKVEDEPFTLEFFIDEFIKEDNNDRFSIFTNEARKYIGLNEKSDQGQEDDQ